MDFEHRFKQLIEKADVETHSDSDRLILERANGVLVKGRPMSIVPVIVAAGIVILIGLVIGFHCHVSRQHKLPLQPNPPQCMLTMESLKQAYCNGGMEGLDAQFDLAGECVGPPTQKMVAQSVPLF